MIICFGKVLHRTEVHPIIHVYTFTHQNLENSSITFIFGGDTLKTHPFENMGFVTEYSQNKKIEVRNWQKFTQNPEHWVHPVPVTVKYASWIQWFHQNPLTLQWWVHCKSGGYNCGSHYFQSDMPESSLSGTELHTEVCAIKIWFLGYFFNWICAKVKHSKDHNMNIHAAVCWKPKNDSQEIYLVRQKQELGWF